MNKPMFLIYYSINNQIKMDLFESKSVLREFIENQKRLYSNWFICSIIHIKDYEIFVDDTFNEGMELIFEK